MKLCVLTVPLYGMSLDAACKYLADSGVQALEIGCGGSPGRGHCDPDVLLHDDAKLKEFADTIKRHGLELAALSCHGNGVHPNPEIAARDHQDFVNACLLAEKLGVKTIVTFSGCPGGSPEDKTPNWVTCPWPTDFADALKYQWEVLIDYWKKASAFAMEHGVERIALEMHPGFCVYNPETMLRLREAVGPIMGANFDPSHLFWQGCDPVESIRKLGEAGAIYHFHAKDTKIDAANTAVNGVLDNKHYGDALHRSWIFRSVGYGHDYQIWKDIISMLLKVGYDGPVSIEHEDALMSVNEGLQKAISLLKEVMVFEDKAEMWWA